MKSMTWAGMAWPKNAAVDLLGPANVRFRTEGPSGPFFAVSGDVCA
jgi:hypothetical protein